jgi:hypothetical protein
VLYPSRLPSKFTHRKHRVRDHLLGSYSGRVIDFLLDKGMFSLESSLGLRISLSIRNALTLQDDRTCSLRDCHHGSVSRGRLPAGIEQLG